METRVRWRSRKEFEDVQKGDRSHFKFFSEGERTVSDISIVNRNIVNEFILLLYQTKGFIRMLCRNIRHLFLIFYNSNYHQYDLAILELSPFSITVLLLGISPMKPSVTFSYISKNKGNMRTVHYL